MGPPPTPLQQWAAGRRLQGAGARYQHSAWALMPQKPEEKFKNAPFLTPGPSQIYLPGKHLPSKEDGQNRGREGI